MFRIGLAPKTGSARRAAGPARRRREDALKLKALRAQLQAGVDALDRGEFLEIDEPDLGAYMTRLVATRRRRR